MKITFRWYGDDDPVTLSQIRQIPKMCGIVSAVYSEAPGNVWSNEEIENLKQKANSNGLEFEVVESVPVPEDIKLGTDKANLLIENYCENVRRLGKSGVKCICYNFMPVFDWLRSELEHSQPDGANALAYDEKAVIELNPMTSSILLPGWDESYGKDELRSLLNKYESISEKDLWNNLTAFLKAVIPVAESVGVKMAIHPDDPPWGIFGLPRIITNEENLNRFLNIYNSESNGITFCTGSLGANENNDLVKMAQRFAKRIPFAHLRNIKRTGNRQFHHGRMIWGEQGRYGYGLYDRALGAAYLNGLFEAVENYENKE